MKEVKDALKILIQGESDAVDHYFMFSEQATKEGYNNIALLFKALAMAEKIHIKNHLNALGEEFEIKKNINTSVLSTKENIDLALNGEKVESRKLYPKLIKSIRKYNKSEYGKVAKLSMTWAKLAEKEHAKLLKIAYASLSKSQDMVFETLSVCNVCGNVVIDQKKDEECKICGHDSIFFETVTKDIL